MENKPLQNIQTDVKEDELIALNEVGAELINRVYFVYDVNVFKFVFCEEELNTKKVKARCAIVVNKNNLMNFSQIVSQAVQAAMNEEKEYIKHVREQIEAENSDK